MALPTLSSIGNFSKNRISDETAFINIRDLLEDPTTEKVQEAWEIYNKTSWTQAVFRLGCSYATYAYGARDYRAETRQIIQSAERALNPSPQKSWDGELTFKALTAEELAEQLGAATAKSPSGRKSALSQSLGSSSDSVLA